MKKFTALIENVHKMKPSAAQVWWSQTYGLGAANVHRVWSIISLEGLQHLHRLMVKQMISLSEETWSKWTTNEEPGTAVDAVLQYYSLKLYYTLNSVWVWTTLLLFCRPGWIWNKYIIYVDRKLKRAVAFGTGGWGGAQKKHVSVLQSS